MSTPLPVPRPGAWDMWMGRSQAESLGQRAGVNPGGSTPVSPRSRSRESVNSKQTLWTPGRKGKAGTESPLRVGNRTAFLTIRRPDPRKAPGSHPMTISSSLHTSLPSSSLDSFPPLLNPQAEEVVCSHAGHFPEPPPLSAYWQPVPSIPGQHQVPFHPNPT